MKIYVAFILLFVAFTSNAQQDYITSMYWNQYAHFNPATSGLDQKMDGRFTFRDQWPSLTSAQQIYAANLNMLIAGHHGVGINYSYDTYGLMKTRTAQVNYNYQFNLRKNRKISIGVSPGIMHVTGNNKWIFSTLNEPVVFWNFEPTSFNLNAGVAYHGRALFGGIGVTHLTSQRYINKDGTTAFRIAQHYYAHLRYKKWLARRVILIGEGIFRTDAVYHSFDINLKTHFLNKFWFGVGYRNRNALSIFGAWDIKERFHIAYSYDHSVSKLNNSIYGGNHEIALGFQIPHDPPKRKPVHVIPTF